MGHRKHNAPRRGSLAFYPRARHQTLVPRIRTWTNRGIEKPTLVGFPAFKAGMAQVITVDDREKTPNFGKPLFNSATILAAPNVNVYGFRAYTKVGPNSTALVDVFADNLENSIKERIGHNSKSSSQTSISKLQESLKKVTSFTALVGVVPSEAGLPIKNPQVQEIGISGGDTKAQFDYLKSILGKQLRATEMLKPGSFVDALAITKGKGFEGVITRFGVKRKQHKSRKTVREVGVISPWHPATVMWTVPRAGQMGFHQRLSRNNRILVVGNAQLNPITPSGGLPHFGDIKGEYVVLRGSVPGPVKRFVDLRLPLYPHKQKQKEPRLIELNVGGKAIPLLVQANTSAAPQPKK